MAVVIETTLGDITVDLYLDQRPVTCLNFLKLCKLKYYNYNLFHSIRSGFIAQTGDPTGEGSGGESIWGILEGPQKRFFSGEKLPKIRHTDAGLISMVCTDDMMVGSQFFFTLGPDLDSLDGTHCVIGEVTEGREILSKLNEVICDESHRPYRDVRITHTVVLEDPFSDPPGFRAPSRSPSPNPERLKGGRIAPDEEIDETQGKSAAEIQELIEEKEAKARATILEIVGDLPDADIAPPENVLFVCKLNPVTTDDDLEIIFSRFGKIVSCEVIRDKTSGNSLQYAFIEFEDKKSCEEAYFKMDNVLIDDRRIHVDFSQSVSKMRWLGKGRGVQYFDNNGKEIDSKRGDIEKNRYKGTNRSLNDNHQKDQYYTEKNKHNRDRDFERYRDKKQDRDRAEKDDRNRKKEDKDRSGTSIKDKTSNEDKTMKEERYKSSKEDRDQSSKEDRIRSRDRGRDRSSQDKRDRSNRDDRINKRKEERDRSRSRHNLRDRIRNGDDKKHNKQNTDKNHRNNHALSNKNSSPHRTKSPDKREKQSPSRKHFKNKEDESHRNKIRDGKYKKNNKIDKERSHKVEKTPSPKKSNKMKKELKEKSKNNKTKKQNKKRKVSTSSDSESSDTSSSSSDTSSSSESDHKKRRVSRKRKHSSSTSSSSSDSSDSSSSSSSSSSSTSSSSSDSDSKSKSRKVVDKKAKKNRKK